ncbi:hypothetical protein [Undibacterium terreum]|uniref:hypothetical protein n=1 Tax=Undibacterium terreum TaxID=1224302 RepID=UPI0016648C2C|nr:hypothetical protein [Undibacterium terreum]
MQHLHCSAAFHFAVSDGFVPAQVFSAQFLDEKTFNAARWIARNAQKLNDAALAILSKSLVYCWFELRITRTAGASDKNRFKC